MLYADDGKRIAPVPRRVAILGMGATLTDFLTLQLQNPGPKDAFDEVWGLNNVCTAMKVDMGFIMDDFVHMLEQPAKGALFWDSSNPGLMRWARETNIPLMTSKSYRPKYPTTIDFPLADVMKSIFGELAGADGMGSGFNLNNSTSYAIAYAWHIGVTEIHVYGCDFAYPWHDPYDRRRYLEESRANVESLLLAGFMLKKFTFHMSARTSLFDTMKKRPFYGYADGRLALPDSLITDKTTGGQVANDTRIIPGEPAAAGATAAPAAVPTDLTIQTGSVLVGPGPDTSPGAAAIAYAG